MMDEAAEAFGLTPTFVCRFAGAAAAYSAASRPGTSPPRRRRRRRRCRHRHVGSIGGARRAATWRHALRSETGAAALEAALLEALHDDAKGLEVDAGAETILLLMDDAPHARLGGHRNKAAGGGQGGLDVAVARRGAHVLFICARDDPESDVGGPDGAGAP